MKAYCPDVTKVQDIYFGYNYEPVVIIDVPRSKMDQMDQIYTAVEQFKNGRFFCGKYESKTMCFPSPHVIIFANIKPKIRNENNELTLSMDRWVIIPLLAQTETKDDFNTMRSFALTEDHVNTTHYMNDPTADKTRKRKWNEHAELNV